MNGIEFLSSKKVVTKDKFNWNCFWSIEIISVVMFLNVGLLEYKQTNNLVTIICISLTGIIFGAIFGYLFGLFTATPVKYAMEYKVAVLSEASIDKLKEEYEIVDKNEKLWTIRKEISE